MRFPCLLRYKTKLKDARKFRASFLLSFRVRLIRQGLFLFVILLLEVLLLPSL